MFNLNREPQMISADLAQAIYYAACEVLGSFELREILKKTRLCVVQSPDNRHNSMSSSEVKDLVILINQRYSLPTGQGFFLRIGRMTFQYLRRNNSQMIIDNSMEKHMQLLEVQINNELKKDTSWLQKNLGYQMDVKKQKGNWMIIVDYPVERSPEINNASFFFLRGFFQECLEWMDNRHRYVISFVSDPIRNNISYSISISSQLND
jgi:hypothetical protein